MNVQAFLPKRSVPVMVVARTCSSDGKSTQALNGRTPLMLAATFGHSAIVTHLLEHRADVNLVCTIRRHQGQSARFTMQACLVPERGIASIGTLRHHVYQTEASPTC